MADVISLLPDGATPFEQAQSETDAARWPLPTHLIKDVWNPATCPLDLLPYLAAGLGLEIWHDEWTEDQKRSVVANIWALKRNKTKLKGLQGYANLEGATIVGARRPRDKFWWSGGQSQAQRDAMMANMPAIRIALYPPAVPAPIAKPFWGGRTIKQFWRRGRAWMPSDAAKLYEGRATYVDQGVSTPVFVNGIDAPLGSSYKVEIVAPALSAKMFWGARRFWGRTAWMGSDALDHVVALTPNNAASGFAIPTGLVPASVRPVLVSDIVPARPGMRFWGSRDKAGLSWGGGAAVWRASDAQQHVYYEVKLFDPARLAPTRQPFSFWGWSRWGRPAYTAQIRMQVNLTRPALQHGYGKPWGAGTFWRKSDMTPLWNALAAVAKAQAFRDTIWVDTKLYTPIQFSPGLRFGEADFQKFGDVRKLL